jgi:hypothetical protein
MLRAKRSSPGITPGRLAPTRSQRHGMAPPRLGARLDGRDSSAIGAPRGVPVSSLVERMLLSGARHWRDSGCGRPLLFVLRFRPRIQ